MKKIHSHLSVLYTAFLLIGMLSALPSLFAEEKPDLSTATEVETNTAVEVAEATEVAVEEVAAVMKEPAVAKKGETLPEYHPEVYILPLGQELNFKVSYDHPMDFEGNDYMESIQLEAIDGQFLGIKSFTAKYKQAFAEFLVNPKLANFDEVVLVGKSTTRGEIRSIHKMELTPVEDLPDEYNPKKMRAALLEKAKEARAKAADKAEKKQAAEAKKKKFGLF